MMMMMVIVMMIIIIIKYFCADIKVVIFSKYNQDIVSTLVLFFWEALAYHIQQFTSKLVRFSKLPLCTTVHHTFNTQEFQYSMYFNSNFDHRYICNF